MTFLSRVSTISFMSLCCLSSGYTQAKQNDNFDVSGYIMGDYDYFDSAFVEGGEESDSSSESAADIRRARLKLKYTFNDDWVSKFQLDFAGGDIDIKDAYIQYRGFSFADVTLGQQKEPFGLEKLTSSRNSFMIERSMVTSALSPGRSLGLSLAGELPSLHWKVGYYQPEDEDSTSAITGRIAWVPWQNDHNLFHVGVAFSERDNNGNDFRINETLEVNFSDSLLEGDKLSIDDISQQSLEMLWIQNNFTLMAEWQQATVSGSDVETHDYEGGYLQMSYQFSGGHRKYKNGVLGNSSKKGWEITSRYSTFALNNEFKDAETYAIGLNYTFNKNFKVMTDLTKANTYFDGINVDSGNAISLRLQYSF